MIAVFISVKSNNSRVQFTWIVLTLSSIKSSIGPNSWSDSDPSMTAVTMGYFQKAIIFFKFCKKKFVLGLHRIHEMIHDNHLAQNKLLKRVEKKRMLLPVRLWNISGHLGYQETVERLGETKDERAFFVSRAILEITNDCESCGLSRQNVQKYKHIFLCIFISLYKLEICEMMPWKYQNCGLTTVFIWR